MATFPPPTANLSLINTCLVPPPIFKEGQYLPRAVVSSNHIINFAVNLELPGVEDWNLTTLGTNEPSESLVSSKWLLNKDKKLILVALVCLQIFVAWRGKGTLA